MTEPKRCEMCESGNPESRRPVAGYRCTNDAYHDTPASEPWCPICGKTRCRNMVIGGYLCVSDDTPASEPPPDHGDFLAARKEGFKAIRKGLDKRRRPSGDTAPETPRDPLKEVDDACMESFKNLPTGAASEDRCPTCKWGRLKPCPDKWHTECDARVAEAVREERGKAFKDGAEWCLSCMKRGHTILDIVAGIRALEEHGADTKKEKP